MFFSKNADALRLRLCERLAILKLTDISMALDERLIDYFDTHEISVKDLDREHMADVLFGYLTSDPELEKG
jgi:hypothetical protein